MFNLSAVKSKQESIKAAVQCEGWSTEIQLGLIYDLLQKTKDVEGDILEIGSAWGRSAVLMGLASRKRIWSIDPHTGGLAYINKGENQNSYDGFRSNIERNGLTSRVKVLRHTTTEVVEQQLVPEGTKFSFAFIDGLHTAEGVRVDIDFTLPRLSKNAIVLFDDYFAPSVVDMKLMIDQKARENGLTLVPDEKARVVYFTR